MSNVSIQLIFIFIVFIKFPFCIRISCFLLHKFNIFRFISTKNGRSYSYDICAIGTEDSFYFGTVNDCLTEKMFDQLFSKTVGWEAVGQAAKSFYGNYAETFLEGIRQIKNKCGN